MRAAIPHRNYTRWTTTPNAEGALTADLIGVPFEILADTQTGRVWLDHQAMVPDLARMIGVRLIEAAALADGDRAIRERAT